METGDKKILLDVGDGPEGIRIYTSDEQGIVDWAAHLPGLYIEIWLDGVYAKYGPFNLKTIHEKLAEALNGGSGHHRRGGTS